MSATVVFDDYGGPEVLHVVDAPVPEPGPGQVRVAVRAAGVQPADALLRSGRFRQWSPATFPQRLGNEFAGVVEALGDGVTGWAVGDEVIGWVTAAAYAQHVLANRTRWWPSRRRCRGPRPGCSPRPARPPRRC